MPEDDRLSGINVHIYESLNRLAGYWSAIDETTQWYFEQIYAYIPGYLSELLSGTPLPRDNKHLTLASWLDTLASWDAISSIPWTEREEYRTLAQVAELVRACAGKDFYGCNGFLAEAAKCLAGLEHLDSRSRDYFRDADETVSFTLTGPSRVDPEQFVLLREELVGTLGSTPNEDEAEAFVQTFEEWFSKLWRIGSWGL